MARALDRNREAALHLSGNTCAAAGQNLALGGDILLKALDVLVVGKDTKLGELTLTAATTWAVATSATGEPGSIIALHRDSFYTDGRGSPPKMAHIGV